MAWRGGEEGGLRILGIHISVGGRVETGVGGGGGGGGGREAEASQV